jgi:hypothetical protein
MPESSAVLGAPAMTHRPALRNGCASPSARAKSRTDILEAAVLQEIGRPQPYASSRLS